MIIAQNYDVENIYIDNLSEIVNLRYQNQWNYSKIEGILSEV